MNKDIQGMMNKKLIEINYEPKTIDHNYFSNYGGDSYQNNFSHFTYSPFRIIDDLVDHGIMIESLLDLGCASGQIVKQFRDLGIRAYGIDNNKKILEHSVCPQYCKVMDMRDLTSIPSNTFDCIYANSLMYLYPKELIGDKGVLSELHRICKKAVYLCNPFKGETDMNSDPYRKFLATPIWWSKQFQEVGFSKITKKIYLKN